LQVASIKRKTTSARLISVQYGRNVVESRCTKSSNSLFWWCCKMYVLWCKITCIPEI